MLKVILLAIALLAIGMSGFFLKLFFQKNGKPVTTSCSAVSAELEAKGVDACVTEGCSPQKIEACKADGLVR